MFLDIKSLVNMVLVRFDYLWAVRAEHRVEIFSRAIDALAEELRGDAQTTYKNHHPKPTNEG